MVEENKKDEIINFVSNFLTIMNLKANVNIEKKYEDCINVFIDGDNLSSLIGKNGIVLKCLELIINVALNKGKEDRIRICLDVCNYRQNRETYLKVLAKKTADEVVKSKKEIVLSPLPPFERKIIHVSLLNHDSVTTYSKGEGKDRRVVITLKK